VGARVREASLRSSLITGSQNLNDAMRLFGVRDLSMLPVVESRKSKHLVGVLYRRDVLNAYRRALLEHQVPDLTDNSC
jgi:predicted transcriptional regulator